MTVADYAAIRNRLDHPQVVVWDPCAVTLAPDDSRAPDVWTEEFVNFLAGFPERTAARLALVGTLWNLCAYEAENPRHDMRRHFALVVGWLCGEEPDSGALHDEGNAVFAALPQIDPSDPVGHGPLENWPSSVRMLNFGAAAMVRDHGEAWYDTDDEIEAPRLGPDGVGPPLPRWAMDLSEAVMFAPADDGSRGYISSFQTKWWARCRALLPIADVTTAKIEWGGIELPRRTVDGDLPGDGSGA